jgi:chemotaxis signal transduction protein
MFSTHSSPRRQQAATPRIAKHKLISFELGSETYGLPIDRVKQILDEFNPHGDLGNGRGLVRFQNQTLTFLDLKYLFPGDRDSRICNYLMICAIASGKFVGLPLPQLPRVLEVAADRFQPIPDLYRQSGLPSAVTSLIYLEGDRELFYLDLEQLIPIQTGALALP